LLWKLEANANADRYRKLPKLQLLSARHQQQANQCLTSVNYSPIMISYGLQKYANNFIKPTGHERSSIMNQKINIFCTDAQIIVPNWGDKVELWHRVVVPARQAIGWRACTTTQCHSRLYTPVKDYEFGYCFFRGNSKNSCLQLPDPSHEIIPLRMTIYF
jgi:hypothetical protein